MKRSRHFFLGIVFFAFFAAAGSVFAHTGFVTSPLWITPESPEQGDTVTLSAVFRNSESVPVSGTVVFSDGDILMANKPVSITANQATVVSTSFGITAGSHSFSATMNTVDENEGSGAEKTVSIPSDTVKMPTLFVPVKISIAAQAVSNAADASEQPILDQIDKAEQNVLGAIPAPTKTSVSSVVQSMDDWRANTAASFTSDAADAKSAAESATVEKTVTTTTVYGTKQVTEQQNSDNSTPLDGPLSYLKYFTFTVLAYIFSTPIAFYLIGILLAYFIIRFIVRRISRAIHNRRMTAKLVKAAKTPQR